MRDNPERGQCCKIRFISCKRPLLQDWERWLFQLILETSIESNKKKKQRTMFQMKEQDKISEKTLMEINKFT